jgi:hypothetical protein
MTVAATLCGFYCALTSAVGIYFYLVLAIMEFKDNLTLKYFWNVERPKTDIFTLLPNGTKKFELLFAEHAPVQSEKGIAFLVLAIIEAVFVVGCCLCAKAS